MTWAVGASLRGRVGRRSDAIVVEPSGFEGETSDRPPLGSGGARRAPGLLRPSRAVPVVMVVIAAAVALVVAGRGESPPGPGEALVEVDGSAFVWRSDGGTETVVDRTRLGPGDRIEVRAGRAELELANEVRYRAVSANSGVAATDLKMGLVPRLRAGALLVDHPVAGSLRSGGGEVDLSPGSVARVTRTAAVNVGVYRGRAVLGSAGETQDLAALRSAEIVGDGELTDRRPLSYEADDAWDRQYLAPAIALDGELQPLVAGMQAGRIDATILADRLRSVVSAPPSADGLASVLAQRTDALDAAVGVAVAGSATEGSFAGRWERAIGFHDAGARWGLVAMDVGADPDAVIEALSLAVQRTPALPENTVELTGDPADESGPDASADTGPFADLAAFEGLAGLAAFEDPVGPAGPVGTGAPAEVDQPLAASASSLGADPESSGGPDPTPSSGGSDDVGTSPSPSPSPAPEPGLPSSPSPAPPEQAAAPAPPPSEAVSPPPASPEAAPPSEAAPPPSPSEAVSPPPAPTAAPPPPAPASEPPPPSAAPPESPPPPPPPPPPPAPVAAPPPPTVASTAPSVPSVASVPPPNVVVDPVAGVVDEVVDEVGGVAEPVVGPVVGPVAGVVDEVGGVAEPVVDPVAGVVDEVGGVTEPVTDPVTGDDGLLRPVTGSAGPVPLGGEEASPLP